MKSFDDVCLEKNISHEDMLTMLVIAGALDNFHDCIINQDWIGRGWVNVVPIEDSLAAGVLHEYSPTEDGLRNLKKIVNQKSDMAMLT